MEVSKITISPQTRMLQASSLSKGKRSKLREELIKEYIRSKPAGYEFSIGDLLRAGGYTNNQYGTGWAFVQRMIKAKRIIGLGKSPGKRKQAYAIPGDALVNTKEGPKLNPEPITSALISEKIDKSHIPQNLGLRWVEDEARQFAWLENSDSLRQFIDYLNKKERQ